MNEKIIFNKKYIFENKIELYFDFINRGRIFKSSKGTIFIIGDPIIDNKIDFEFILKKINSKELDKSSIKKINGEFLIIIVNANLSIKIINDRFSSIPLFYSISRNRFRASINFLTLFKTIENKNLNHNKFMEFLYFQRIHGEDTYEKSIKSMNSASIIEYNINHFKSIKYWHQDYKKDYSITLKDYAEKLSQLIKKSIRIKTSDIELNEDFGMFLSGGMDSRTVIGSFENKKPIAFTLGFSEKGEYRVSKKITKINSNKHNFIKLENNHFIKNFEKLIHLCSGLYRFDHGLFSGIKDQLSKHVKIVINSTALDYWFQGYYIPKTNYKLIHKPTYFNKIRKQEGYFQDDYFNNIPFKYKNINPLDFIESNSKKDEVTSFIKNEVKKIYDYGMNNGCNNFYDSWDFILNDNISRHFSYSNNLSMHDSCEPRTIAFENEIFDLFLKIPIEYRFGAAVSKETLKIVNYKFAKIISANHGMKITASPLEMTMSTIFKKLASKFSNSKKFKHPTASDRTWPDPFQYLINNKFMVEKALDLKSSEFIKLAMPYFNIDKLNNEIDGWLSGDKSGVDFIYRLITINEFLKQGYK
ncbi:MAG: asparagine synthase-related protein [Flavobacteriaceae bacterium]|nr:asparagine synthase-related protein [Flavobacteriaceae bacterium]